MPHQTLIIYCLAICAASFAGGGLPVFLRITHRRMQFIMSFVGGLMLGVAVLHLLPHALSSTGSLDLVFGSTLAGILLTFGLIRVFHIHQHEPMAAELPTEEDCDHAHAPDHAHHHHHPEGGSSGVGWLGLLAGLCLHTLIDGAALGADVFTDAEHAHGVLYLAGFGTFLAVILHKPLDALALTSLMKVQGWSTSWVNRINGLFSLMCPLGAFAFVFGVRSLTSNSSVFLGGALAFAAGAFLCIALADLLPEIQFHQHDRWQLSASLLLGVALAYGIGYLEGGHKHHLHDGSTETHTEALHHDHGELLEPAHDHEHE